MEVEKFKLKYEINIGYTEQLKPLEVAHILVTCTRRNFIVSIPVLVFNTTTISYRASEFEEP